MLDRSTSWTAEIAQKTVRVKLRASCRVTYIPNRVTHEGPTPRPRLINKLAAVKAAPRVSGGLTLMRQGRTLTDGKDATNPLPTAKRMPKVPCARGMRTLSSPKKGKTPNIVVAAMKSGKYRRSRSCASCPQYPPKTPPTAHPIPNKKTKYVAAGTDNPRSWDK